MGITINEFVTAMETYGAKRTPELVSLSGNLEPCFAVKDVLFLHSGTYYIVQRGCKVPDEIMHKAMAEFGEKNPGGDNFWYGEIHTIKGILTLSAMLEGKYSKELVNKLTNTTYKKVLNCPLIQKNVNFPFPVFSPKMAKLQRKLAEYDSFVNPFSNNTFTLKEPIEYLDKVKPSLTTPTEVCQNSYAILTLNGRSSQVHYNNGYDEWNYDTMIYIQKNRLDGYIFMDHYYQKGCNNKPVDEVIHLSYKSRRHTYTNQPADITLNISLKTGLAWQTNRKNQAMPATDEQIDIIIEFLNINVKKIKQRIIRYMIIK